MYKLLKTIFLFFNYNHRRRQLDIKILWPVCRHYADNLDHAKAAFALHAFADPAWKSLKHEEILRRIEALN
jgi:hypothetical protein